MEHEAAEANNKPWSIVGSLSGFRAYVKASGIGGSWLLVSGSRPYGSGFGVQSSPGLVQAWR